MPEVAWLIPLAVAGLTALAAVAVAAINKRRARPDPADQMNTFIAQVQDDRQKGREQLATMTAIASQFMGESVRDRAHSTAMDAWAVAVNAWIDDGMPNPPGQPLRPIR